MELSRKCLVHTKSKKKTTISQAKEIARRKISLSSETYYEASYIFPIHLSF